MRGSLSRGTTLRLARRTACGAAVLSVALGATRAEAQDSLWVRGVVTEAEGGGPLPGAEVLLEDGRAGRARTDARGAWRLRVADAGAVRVRARRPGYAWRERLVDPRAAGDTPIVLALPRLALALDAVVVTAARREQRLADAVVETEVIGAEEIARRSATDVAALLTERSGLQLDGGVPAGAGAQMRGFDSRRVLVLLDGQPLVGRVNGTFDLSRLPTAGLARIEVVKGPQSTLYGSEALGGVINLITRRAEEEGWDAGLALSGGSQGRRDGAGDARWRRGRLGGTLDAGLRRQDLAPGVPGTAGTFARRANGAGTLRWERGSGRSLEAAGHAILESQRYRTGQLFNFADNAQWGGRASAVALVPGGRLTGTLHLSAFDHLSRRSTRDRPASDSGARDAQRLLQADLLYNAQRGRVAVDAGVQLRREGITADRLSVADPSVRQAEPFAQATLALGQVQLVPGARLTVSDRWGRFVAPRLAALWRPREALGLRVALGRGFRAPDFKELYLDFVNTAAGYAVRGNAALRPEASTSLTSGLEWTGTRTWLRASAYANDYRDFIEAREPDAAGTYTYGNIARGRIAGLEVEGGWRRGGWSVDGSYDRLRARDLDREVPLLGRPAHTLRAAMSTAPWHGLRGTSSALYTGRTPLDRAADGTVTRVRDGWTRVDARLTQSLPGELQWTLGVTNLLDTRLLAQWPGFTGRQVVLALGWRTAAAR